MLGFNIRAANQDITSALVAQSLLVQLPIYDVKQSQLTGDTNFQLKPKEHSIATNLPFPIIQVSF